MLNIAIRAARAAGAIINRAALDIDVLKVASKGINDFVTEVDRAAEEAVIETLLEAYPTHSILADPRFANLAQGDFVLPPDSPAFKVGFKPMDLRGVGVRKQGER